MHFLADESCDFAVVRSLRGEGHDVLAVAEAAPRSQDDIVLELARQIKRILLTEDKDLASGSTLISVRPAESFFYDILRVRGRRFACKWSRWLPVKVKRYSVALSLCNQPEFASIGRISNDNSCFTEACCSPISRLEAENSNGFHADQESMRLLGESINYCRQGQMAMRGRVTGSAPTTQAARDNP
jgi:hypothetical protein